jgi:hypothetical protein
VEFVMITFPAIALAVAAWIGPVAGSSPPIQRPAADADCMTHTDYRRLNDREIEAAVVGKRLVYNWREGIYRAIRDERFDRRRNRYLVRYEGQLSSGTYEITGGRLCTRELNDSFALCRRMFHSARCGYAMSEPGADHPRYRVRIDD